MQAQKLQVKFFANAEISETALVPVFHDWIRERVVPDELLIDVADYSHVPDGPGVMIIGHHADYAAATVAPHPSTEIEALARATHYLLDTRITIAWAKALGNDQIVQLLQQNLDEEKKADSTLNQMAATVNKSAMAA